MIHSSESLRSRGSLNESIHDLFKLIISLNTAAYNNVFDQNSSLLIC